MTMVARTRRRRWAGSIVAALLLGEGLARYYISAPLDILRRSPDPALLFELKPGRYISDGYFTRTDPVEYVVDQRGCRVGEADPLPVGPAVIFLGSSMVFGIGVDAHDMISEAARREVRERRPGLDLIPLSCSVPGYNLVQTLRYAELALERKEARAVALVVMPNHARVAYDWTRLVPSSPTLHWLTAHSRLARLGYLYSAIQQTRDIRPPPIPADELRAALDRFAAAVHATSAQVQIFPVDTFDHPDVDLVAELAARGLPALTIQPPPAERPYVLSDGEHWSPEGVRFIVRQMAPALVALVERSTAAR
jgi:hypothetical protein